MKNLTKILKFVMVVSFVAAIVMIFLPAIGSGDDAWNGLKVVFGYTKKSGNDFVKVELEIFKFSFMNLLTYILVLVALALTLLQTFGKKSNMFGFVTVVCALVAAVFFFLTKNFTVLGDATSIFANHDAFVKNAELGVGPILGGIFCLVGMLASAALLALPKGKTKRR